jgi:hypothetical protein
MVFVNESKGLFMREVGRRSVSEQNQKKIYEKEWKRKVEGNNSTRDGVERDHRMSPGRTKKEEEFVVIGTVFSFSFLLDVSKMNMAE